jgi:hypothetical protein
MNLPGVGRVARRARGPWGTQVADPARAAAEGKGTMLTLVLWFLGMAFMPLALHLVGALIAGVGRLMGFGAASHPFDEFERRRDLCSLNSDHFSSSASIAGRISPSGAGPLSASRH